jgi:hypothetical protein
MKYINTVLLALPLLFLPISVRAQAPAVSTSVGELTLSNAQCLRRAQSIMSERGYSGFSRVGDNSDTSLYGRRRDTTVVIRCVTKFNVAVVVYSSTDPETRQDFEDIADSFFGN